MKPMGAEIHEIWEIVKQILDILDEIYHAVIDKGDANEDKED